MTIYDRLHLSIMQMYLPETVQDARIKNMIELSRLTLNLNKLAIQASIQVCHMLLYSEVHILG